MQKKTSNGYILNFFADSTDDVEAFNPDKSWGMYGKPIPGSVLTVTSNEEVFNYYLNESGALVEIAIDKPVEGLVPLALGDYLAKFRVAKDMSIEEINAILASLTYDDNGEAVLIRSADTDTYGLVNASNDVVYSISLIDGLPIYISEDIDDGDMHLKAGWQSSFDIEGTVYDLIDENGVMDFEHLLEQIGGSGGDMSLVLTELNQADAWNGILLGSFGGEPVKRLTRFYEGQTLSGLDFGDAVNGQFNDALTQFVLASTAEEHDQILLSLDDNVSHGDDFIARYSMGNKGILVYVSGEGASVYPLYATEAGEMEGVSFSAGFQNLVDGKFIFTNSVSVDAVNNDIAGWNGVLVGAIEGQPAPSTLTPFTLGDYISGYKINVEGDKAALDSFLANFPTTYGEHKLILQSGTGGDGDFQVNVANTISGTQMWEDYVLFVNGGDGFFIYSTNEQHTMILEGIDVPAGWSSVDPQTATFTPVTTNQEVALEGSQEVTICESLAEAINGIYVGAIPGEEPQPSSLTPISVGQDVVGYKFDTSLSANDVDHIMSQFDYKSLSDGVIVDCSNDHGLIMVSYDGKDYFIYIMDQHNTITIFDGSWNNLDNNGVYTLSGSAAVTRVENTYATGWNGVIVGAITK